MKIKRHQIPPPSLTATNSVELRPRFLRCVGRKRCFCNHGSKDQEVAQYRHGKKYERAVNVTISYDANIWGDIVNKLMMEHQIERDDLYKILAFWFDGWGMRSWDADKQTWNYSLNEEGILDSRMGGKFFKEAGKAIRNCRDKLSQIDSLWRIRSGLGPMTDFQTEYKEPTESDQDMIDNLLYGVSDED